MKPDNTEETDNYLVDEVEIIISNPAETLGGQKFGSKRKQRALFCLKMKSSSHYVVLVSVHDQLAVIYSVRKLVLCPSLQQVNP